MKKLLLFGGVALALVLMASPAIAARGADGLNGTEIGGRKIIKYADVVLERRGVAGGDAETKVIEDQGGADIVLRKRPGREIAEKLELVIEKITAVGNPKAVREVMDVYDKMVV